MTIKDVQEWGKLRPKLIVYEQRESGGSEFQTFYAGDINE